MSQGGKLSVSSGPGSGDVVGPASSTNNDIVVFNGTTGKIIKDTGISSISPTFTGTVTAGTGLSVTTGDATIVDGNLNLPNTNGAGTAGEITMNSVRVMSNYGTQNFFLGANSGNTTNFGQGNIGIGDFTFGSLDLGAHNVAAGTFTLAQLTNGNENVAVGYAALSSNDSDNNVGVGSLSGQFNTGTNNTLIGYRANGSSSSSSGTTVLGANALFNNATGDNNVAIGVNAGNNYTSSESNNICIANAGVLGESNKLRIGTNGSGSNQVDACFIAGITGITITGGATVLCDGSGQLGTVSSSERFKDNIQDIPEKKSILNLRPVQFNYKSDEDKTTCYGLIAEEVRDEFEDLCIYDDDEVLYSVKYHEMPALLLLEIQRLAKRVEELEKNR